MTKIKITEKEIEIEGKIEDGKVTPFGSSAHIPFGKTHRGKIVKIVIPTKTKYIWLISMRERNRLLKIAKKNIENKDGKLEHYRLSLIEELKEDTFDIDSLIKVLKFVPNFKLISKIKELYDL